MIGMESSVGLAFFLRNLGALCISVMEFRSKNDSPQNCRVRRGGAESLSDGHFREVHVVSTTLLGSAILAHGY